MKRSNKKTTEKRAKIKERWGLLKDVTLIAKEMGVSESTIRRYLKEMNINPSKIEKREEDKKRFAKAVTEKVLRGCIWVGFNDRPKKMRHYEAYDRHRKSSVNPIVAIVKNGKYFFHVKGKQADRLLLLGVGEAGNLQKAWYMPRSYAKQYMVTINKYGKTRYDAFEIEIDPFKVHHFPILKL